MAVDRMQRQRFELKYMLSEHKALEVRSFVRGYLELDEAGIGRPNDSYRVNSLYLDSTHLYTFWDWVNANRNRFKLRMRYYDSDPETPLFLEIKRRISNCILKQRAVVRKAAAEFIVKGQLPPKELVLSKDAKGFVALERFTELVAKLHAHPMALVTYLREAYVDPTNDGVRVTMDRQVLIDPRKTCDFSLEMNGCVQPFGDQVILELKFNNRFPQWFGDMVRMLQLPRAAAAKYCEGMAAVYHPQLGSSRIRPKQRRMVPANPKTAAHSPLIPV